MSKRTCSLPGCERPHRARGMCSPHYYAAGHGFTPRPCRVSGCENMTDHKTADGLCVMHYGRKRRVGSLQVSLYKKPWLTPGEILWDRSEPHGDCILWTGGLTHDGYGSLGPSWIYSKAHRVSWFLVHGEIADGIEIDHLCHNRDLDCMPAKCVHRRCINPDHLEAVSHDENMRRQFARVA